MEAQVERLIGLGLPNFDIPASASAAVVWLGFASAARRSAIDATVRG